MCFKILKIYLKTSSFACVRVRILVVVVVAAAAAAAAARVLRFS